MEGSGAKKLAEGGWQGGHQLALLYALGMKAAVEAIVWAESFGSGL